MKAKFVFTADELIELAQREIVKENGHVFINGVQEVWFVDIDTGTGRVTSVRLEIEEREEERKPE